jgi:preprotein translocase subunit SecD
MRILIAAIGGLLVGGCVLAQPGGAPPSDGKIKLRFCWATADEREGYVAAKDEAGQPLRVLPEPVVTEADVESASLWRGPARNMVLLKLTPLAAAQLEAASTEHIGDRLAIYIDERLILSPIIRKPLAGGKVYLNGEFSAQEADRIVARLNGPHATTQAIIR